MSNYANVGFVPGKSDFADISLINNTPTASFAAKTASVNVGSTTKRMTSAGLTYVAPFPVYACDDNNCEVGKLNASAKISLNFPYGDAVTRAAIVTEVNRLLNEWVSGNLDVGIVPNPTAVLD